MRCTELIREQQKSNSKQKTTQPRTVVAGVYILFLFIRKKSQAVKDRKEKLGKTKNWNQHIRDKTTIATFIVLEGKKKNSLRWGKKNWIRVQKSLQGMNKMKWETLGRKIILCLKLANSRLDITGYHAVEKKKLLGSDHTDGCSTPLQGFKTKMGFWRRLDKEQMALL